MLLSLFCSDSPIVIKHVKLLNADKHIIYRYFFLSLEFYNFPLWKEVESEKDMGNVQCSCSFISEGIFNNQYILITLSKLKRIFMRTNNRKN